MLKLIGSLSLVWLLMATSTTAQSTAILDVDGQPLTSGVEYYVLPAATDTAGGLTLVNRTGSCPLYVGQEPLSTVVSQGLPVIFTPTTGDSVVRADISFGIEFSAVTICAQSTAWRVSEEDAETSKRFVLTGPGEQSLFRIQINDGLYNIIWCPVCDRPNCPRFICSSAGITIENGNRLLTLEIGSAFPFRFRRAN